MRFADMSCSCSSTSLVPPLLWNIQKSHYGIFIQGGVYLLQINPQHALWLCIEMGSWGRSNHQYVQLQMGVIQSLRLNSLSGNRQFIPLHTSTEDQMFEPKNLPKPPNDCIKMGCWVTPQVSPTHLSPWQITTSKGSGDLVYILH